MCNDTAVQFKAVQIALTAYKQATGSEQGGIDLTIELIADCRQVAENLGIDFDGAAAEVLWRTERPRRYNGWTNYETWLVNLWLTNEEPSYRYWNEQAAEQITQAPKRRQVAENVWSEAEAARFGLADKLRHEIEQGKPSIDGSLYADLLSASLGVVDWTEIAESILSGLDE